MSTVVRIPLRRKLLYLGIVVALLLLACEGGLRLRAWLRYGTSASVRDPMLTYDAAARIYVPTPGYEVKGAKIHIKINSLGFRGEEFSRTKPPGTFRIVCLGASTTRPRRRQTTRLTHRLQEKLRAAIRGVARGHQRGGRRYVASDNLRNLRMGPPARSDLVITTRRTTRSCTTQELAHGRAC
jgi:hypothetical protein